ncbi:Type-1 restriction enzyme EcoKI specificity protein [Marinomonas spartinae]|uniref:restriction endonuclease subunit S n=1 Tax=Marinomonas spartinae TaxID=1792290 RepID=UPI000808B25F|nr:restriction endonuclease subunit S [Marinomonas spartinae]SBS37863.1 Type-1 restriction enzyme EcoKI specificity protein [Marinomonas spartinae]
MTWPVMPLSNLVDVMHQGINTAADKVEYSQSGYPIIQSKHLKENCVDFDGVKYLSESDFQKYSPKYVPQKGDILFANIGSIGKSLIIDTGSTFLFAWNVFLIRPKQELIDVSYLKYFFDRLLSIKYYDQYLTGGTVKFVNKKVMGEIEIPLPPLEEQKRIAAILDKADSIRRKRQQAIQLADEFLRSVFLDMFGDFVDSGWKQSSVEKIVSKKGGLRTGPFGSQLLHSEFVESGISVLGIDNAVDNNFKWGKPRFITPEKYEKLKKYTVYSGDVLITIMGTCGRCAVVPDDIPVAINTKHLCCITVDTRKCLPDYLHAFFLYHRIARNYLKASTKGAIMDGLNLGVIKEMPILLPPLDLQHKFSAIKTKQRSTLATMNDDDSSLFRTLSSALFSGCV